MNLKEIKKLSEAGELLFQKKEEPEDSSEKKLPSLIWINEFLSIAGSYMYEREDDRPPNDLDIVIKADALEDGFIVKLDPSLRLKIDRIMAARFGIENTQWIGSPPGPNWRYRPLYDLALIPRSNTDPVEINEPEFAGEFYKEQHRLDQCMDCSKEPDFEILWAEGMGHAWFCSNHLREFITENKDDIDAIKVIRDETASIKFQNNREPNQRDKVLAEFQRTQKQFHVFQLSKSEDERIVCGIVYAPDTVDLQGDKASAEEIKKAAWSFMENGGVFRFNHGDGTIQATTLETFIAPVDYTIKRNDGVPVTVQEGSWVLTARINDPDIWNQIKAGKIVGYSMAGKSKVRST